jgi:hypothetical protein
LHSYGLPEGYDKLVISDIIGLLIDALQGIGVADNKLLQAHTKADYHNPRSPDARVASADRSNGESRPAERLGIVQPLFHQAKVELALGR